MKHKFLISILIIFSLIETNARLYGNKNYFFYNLSCSDKLEKRGIKDTIFTYTIPVKFFIIRKNDKDKKTGPAYLKELIQYLNYYYSINNTGISFSLRPDFEYIDKSKLLNLQYYKQAPFLAFKAKTKACINVIITGNLVKKKFLKSRKKKYAGTYNPLANTIIISRNTSTSTLSHEIGHYLGLKHPHRGWKYKWFQEPVSRTKKTIFGKRMCEKKGDKLCDTPAEPNLTKYTDKKCNYTGWNVKDKYGEVYKPDTHNIMSYTNNRECRNKFTKGQIAIMRKTLAKNKYTKYWRTDIPENKKILPDAFEPDNYKETATEIFFNTPQTHSFHFIQTGKKNKLISDTTDWLFFDLKAKRKNNIKISFLKMKDKFPHLKIIIFNQEKTVLNKEITKPVDFYLKELNLGIYYIKISNLEIKKNVISYKIIIVK